MKIDGKDKPKTGAAAPAAAVTDAVNSALEDTATDAVNSALEDAATDAVNTGLPTTDDDIDPGLMNGAADDFLNNGPGDHEGDGDNSSPNGTEQPLFEVAVANPNEFIKEKIEKYREEKIDNAFYVANLKVIEAKYDKWVEALPRVKPYYEVRCNNDPAILYLLNEEGVGFACSSKGEIDELLRLGVTPASILLTSACKVPSHIRHAATVGVTTMMFDNNYELQKIKDNFPTARLVLQIKSSDQEDMSLLENQYGCPMEDVEGILTDAKELELNVIGISFQVPGVQGDGEKYVEGLEKAKNAIEIGTKLGFKFELIDIGGGFPGESNCGNMFKEITTTLKTYIDKNFPKKKNINIFAEAGVFLVNSAYNLVANIIGKRDQSNGEGTKLEDENESPEEEPGNEDGNPGADNAEATDEVDGPLANGDGGEEIDEETTAPDNADSALGSTKESEGDVDAESENGNDKSSYSSESEQPGGKSFIYYINDGVLGPTPPHIAQTAIGIPKNSGEDGVQVYPTSIWDQTATNGQSCTQPGVQLPELDVGDWVVFADCGAYTFVMASNFTSPQKAEIFYVSWEETPPTDTPKKKKRKSKECSIL